MVMTRHDVWVWRELGFALGGRINGVVRREKGEGGMCDMYDMYDMVILGRCTIGGRGSALGFCIGWRMAGE